MRTDPSSGDAGHARQADADVASFRLLEKLPFGAALFRVVREPEHGAIVDFVSVRKNREFMAIVGLDGDLGRGHFERFPDARSTLAARRFLETIERVLASGRPEAVETYAPSPARSYQFELADAGIADHLLIVVRRITDNVAGARQIEQLVREQEFLFEGQSIGYWKSVNRVFSWTNAVFDQMLGYQRHELLGRSSRVIYPSAELFEAIGKRLGDPEQARTGIHFDAQFVRKDGRTGWFEVVLQQISDDGEMTLIGSCIDRSSEACSLLALRKSEQRLMTCLKGSGSAYFDWDLSSGEVEFDRGLRAILGTLPGNSFAALLAMTHRADREIVQRYLDGHRDSDIVSNGCEFRVRHSDGHWIWVLLRGSVVEFDEFSELSEFNESGESKDFDASDGRTPARMAGTITDVTAMKRIERETGQLLHRLEHLIKERISPHDRSVSAPSAASRVSVLSRRQTEVLRLIAAGNTSVEIAKRLHISETTVQSHRKEIMQKLGQKNVATLTRFAIEAGLV